LALENSEPAAPQSQAVDEQAALSPMIDQQTRERFVERVLNWRSSLSEVREAVAKELSQLNNGLEALRHDLNQLDQAIALEQGRLDKATQLREVAAGLKERIEDRRHHTEVCRVAGELIQGAIREISHMFNRKLRGLAGKTLPLFTEQRYEHLQIEDDLTVRVFSSEKQDFMDLEEISSGTQRQIMLAVRLALSQELVDRAIRGGQFLFLDEPFAFFDEQRTRNSLAVLPTLSEDLNQIWIVSQDFAEDLHFDHHVRCDRTYQVLPAIQD
jgi:exonuclease SbcC